MGPGGVQRSAQGDRAGKRRGRRPRGVALKDRGGYWHAHGSLRAGERSIRVRRSLGLAVATTSERAAEIALQDYLDELTARVTGKVGRGDPVSIAAAAYLALPRERPLGPAAITIIKQIDARFGPRRLNEIGDGWNAWIDGEHTPAGFMRGRATGLAPASRERLLGGVLGFLNYCKRRHGLVALPTFERNKAARNPNRRARRRVADLRPELIRLLFDSAHISIRAQLAVERATGARVSSILYGARVCDLIIGSKRSQITFNNTKNGLDVPAALDTSTVAILKEYLKWRGKLHDREAPLFLTYRRKPYVDNGKAYGGQNKTGFKAARRRAIATLTERAEAEARRLRAAGRRRAADELLDQAKADAALLASVTQHWFRHRLATLWLRKDPRAAMGQGGWLDPRSVFGYSHDVPEFRHQLVAELDDLGTPLTHDVNAPKRKAR